MRVADRNYHEDCLSCTACGTMLSHSCFYRDLKLYCRSDYERIFGAKCARCMEKISCSDLVMRPVSGLVFHVECFACCMCGQPLPRGAHYILRQGQPICRRDFEHELFLNSPQGECLVCSTSANAETSVQVDSSSCRSITQVSASSERIYPGCRSSLTVRRKPGFSQVSRTSEKAREKKVRSI